MCTNDFMRFIVTLFGNVLIWFAVTMHLHYLHLPMWYYSIMFSDVLIY